MKVSIIKNATSALTSHIHQKSDWMVGYHFMGMNMEPNRDNSSDMGISAVLADFMVAPVSMEMDMHMFHG